MFRAICKHMLTNNEVKAYFIFADTFYNSFVAFEIYEKDLVKQGLFVMEGQWIVDQYGC